MGGDAARPGPGADPGICVRGGGHIPPSSPSPPLHVLRFFDRSCTGIFCIVTIATTGAIFSLQFTKNRLAAGLHPDPLGELERSPDPLAAKQGAYF